MSIVLTRFLYEKHDVLFSLEEAINEGSNALSEAMFWALELYHSGIIQDLYILLERKIEQCSNDNIALKQFLQKRIKIESDLDIQIATIIYHLTTFDITRTKFAIIQRSNIEKYANPFHDIIPRMVLQHVFSFTLRRKSLRIEHYSNHRWVTYASFSPIWANRIEQYGGFHNPNNGIIEFESDDDFEQFFERYEYEPEEQSVEIQQRYITIQ
jgi:hypothetical protein